MPVRFELDPLVVGDEEDEVVASAKKLGARRGDERRARREMRGEERDEWITVHSRQSTERST